MTAKRGAILLASALLGGMTCVAIVVLANALNLVPVFPAYGGEADFDLRLTVFLSVTLPGFCLLGGVVAYRRITATKSWVRSALGALGGSGMLFASAWFCRDVIEHIATRETANGTAMAFLALWVVFAWVGALLSSTSIRERVRRDGAVSS